MGAFIAGCRPAPRANVGDTHFILELFPQECKLMKKIKLAPLSRGAVERRTHFIHTNTNDFQILWVRAQMARGRDTGDNCLEGLVGLRRVICRKWDIISTLRFSWEHLRGTRTQIRPNTRVTRRRVTFQRILNNALQFHYQQSLIIDFIVWLLLQLIYYCPNITALISLKVNSPSVFIMIQSSKLGHRS